MKKVLFPRPDLRQEISLTTHQQHQNALLEGISSIIKALGVSDAEYTILYGLETVVGSPDWEISPGAIYHDGEVYICEGIEGNDGGNVPVLTITETAVGADAKFSDFTSRTVHVDRKMVISFAAVDSGDVNYTDLVSVDDKIYSLLGIEGRLASLFNAKTSLGVTTLDHTYFVDGVNWNVDNSSRLKKDNNGLVQVILRVVNDGATSANKTLTTLPLGYRPSVNLSGVHAIESSFDYGDDSGRGTPYYAQVETNGVISIPIMDATRIPSDLFIHITFFNA